MLVQSDVPFAASQLICSPYADVHHHFRNLLSFSINWHSSLKPCLSVSLSPCAPFSFANKSRLPTTIAAPAEAKVLVRSRTVLVVGTVGVGVGVGMGNFNLFAPFFPSAVAANARRGQPLGAP
jgi:hypothetical protein